MPVRCAINQPNHVSPSIGNQHIKALPETQLPHNIVREVPEPIGHVADNITTLLLRVASSVTIPIGLLPSQRRAELPHMQEHDILHGLERMVRERLAQHAPLAPMYGLIDGVVGVVHALDGGEGIVEVGLSGSLSVSVDIVQTLVGVDGHEVRSHPNVRAIFSVQSVQPQVPVAPQAMV